MGQKKRVAIDFGDGNDTWYYIGTKKLLVVTEFRLFNPCCIYAIITYELIEVALLIQIAYTLFVIFPGPAN